MNFRYRLMRFLSGRYGTDSLFFVLFGVSAVLAFVNIFVRSFILQMVVYAIVFLAVLRAFSRNYEARSKENRAIEGLLQKISQKVQTHRQRRMDKTHIYRKCPRCKAILRLPRRKGRHKTCCPKCRNEFRVVVFK